MGGVSTTLSLLPDENAVVVVLCNSSSRLTGQIAREILSVLAPDKTEVVRPNKPEVVRPNKPEVPAPNKTEAQARLLWRLLRQHGWFSKSRETTSSGPQFRAMPELNGVWSGKVSTYGGSLPVTFVIRKSGEVYVQLSGRPWTLLDQAKFSGGVLRGVFAGDVGTVDANRRPYNLRLQVKKRGNVLNGSLIALSLPGRRVGNALTHWIELRRD